MGQHDPHCKRHHGRDQSSDSRGENRIPTERHNNQRVNKIASIDIWATERLYEKWRQQAIGEEVEKHHSPSKAAERPTLYNYNATQPPCQRHGGSASERYFTASLAQPMGTKLGTVLTIGDPSGGRIQAQHSTCHRQGRAQSRPDESRLTPERWYFLQNKTHRRRQSQSLSSERVPPIHCQCNLKCQQQKNDDSDQSSDADTPNSWTPIWGTSALNVTRVGSNDKNLANESLPNNCRRQQRSQSRPRKQGHSREKQPAKVQSTITINSEEREGPLNRPKNVNRCDRRGAQKIRQENSRKENLASGKPALVYRLTSNSVKQRKSRSEKYHSQLSNQSVPKKEIQDSIDQSTYTIIRDISCSRTETQSSTRVRYIKSEDGNTCNTGDTTLLCDYGIARICKTEKCPIEKVEALPKPVVWLMAEQSATDVRPSSVNEGSTVRLSGVVDNKTRSSATFVKNAATGKAKKGARQGRLDKQSSRHKTLRNLTVCNNSDGKSLRMLSTISNENKTETQTSSSLRAAQVSKVTSSRYLSIARCYLPKVMMQSNASMAKDTIDDTMKRNGSILLEHEVGAPIIMESRSASVTRHVQNAVQRAKKLFAARGFAGLVARRSNTDTNTTVTAGTETDVQDDDDDDDDDDDVQERYRYTDSEERDLREFDKLDSVESDTEKRKARLRQPRKSKEGRKRARQGGDQERDDSSSSRQADLSKKLLPMTECPTTRHRVECYRTRSGRVKCYMTARHPVKCCIQDGRIVCKPTVNPQPSELPNLCDAKWQCQ